MAVFRAGKSQVYRYDFRLDGRRFYGSTGARTKPEARAVERKKREEARAEMKAVGGLKTLPMTLDIAAGQFMENKGNGYRGNAAKTFKASLGWIVDRAGPNTLIRDIDTALVTRLITIRKAQRVAPATVNRTVTEPLRRVLRYASEVYEQPVAKIPWGKLLLAEPRERVREMSAEEELRLLPTLAPDYRNVVMFSVLSGCRLAECVWLEWTDVDWGNRSITVRGKGGTVEPIPLSGELRELLWALRGQHPERVFTYAASTGRQPISYEGMKTAWRRALERAGVKGLRFHDLRHTAATRLLRSGANIKSVQKLLRHTDITTTSKYAHVTMDDLREAMDRASERFSVDLAKTPNSLPVKKG